MSTKQTEQVIAPRGKTEANTKRHAALCAICNHDMINEIESQFMDFKPVIHIAEQFGVSDDSVYRHAEFFGLDDDRVADTEKVLRNIVARGFAQVTKIDGKLLIEAVKELNRQTGQRQEDRKNTHDLTPQQQRKLEAIRRERPEVQQTDSANN